MNNRLPDGIDLITENVGGKLVQFVALHGGRSLSYFDCGLNGFATHHPEICSEEPHTVVISHADADHFGNASTLKTAFPQVNILAHAADRHWIEQPDVLVRERYDHARERFAFGYESAQLTAMRQACGDGVHVDGLLSSADTIELGAFMWQVLHIPGHSPGHIGLWNASEGVLLLGDAVLGLGIPGADGRICMPPTHQFIDDYLRTIEQLKSLPVRTVLSGHWPVLDGNQFQSLLHDSKECVARDLAFVRSQLNTGPTTFAQLMQRLNESFRQWPATQDIHYSYALSGYIEYLEQGGELHVTKGEIYK